MKDIEELLAGIEEFRKVLKEKAQAEKKLEEENAALNEFIGSKVVIDPEIYRSIIDEAAGLKEECEKYKKMVQETAELRKECERYKRLAEEARKAAEKTAGKPHWKRMLDELPSKGGWYFLIWSGVKEGHKPEVMLPMVVEYKPDLKCFVKYLDTVNSMNKIVFGESFGADIRGLYWSEICPPEPALIKDDPVTKAVDKSLRQCRRWTAFCERGKDDDYIDACLRYGLEELLKELENLEKQK